MVDRLVKEMGVEGRKSAYESVLQPGAVKRLSMKNDPVFFIDELTRVFARHPNWTMPKDQLNGTAQHQHGEMYCQTCVWRFLCAYCQIRLWSRWPLRTTTVRAYLRSMGARL